MHVFNMLKNLLFALSVLLVPSWTWAQGPLVIKFSHVVSENTPKGLAALEFKRLVEQRSKGKIKVEVYPDSTLYKDKDELEALQLGAVQMLAPSLAKFGQLGIREFEVFDLPYLFSNTQSLHAVTQGDIGRQLLNLLESRGIKGLAFWDNGFKVISAHTPVRTPSDLRGKHFRIQNSRTLEAQVEELGALPIPMAFSEVYSALESGYVDATENPPSNFYSKSLYKVQKHLTLTNHGHLGYAVIFSKKFWDKLNRDQQTLVQQCIQESTLKNHQLAQSINQEALQEMRKRKLVEIIELKPDQLRQWKVRFQPVYRKMAPSIGEDLIEKIRRIDQQQVSNR